MMQWIEFLKEFFCCCEDENKIEQLKRSIAYVKVYISYFFVHVKYAFVTWKCDGLKCVFSIGL